MCPRSSTCGVSLRVEADIADGHQGGYVSTVRYERDVTSTKVYCTKSVYDRKHLFFFSFFFFFLYLQFLTFEKVGYLSFFLAIMLVIEQKCASF